MPLAEIGGIKINYEVDGEGFPLLLIHGLGMDMTSWQRGGLLRELARDNKVIAYDCRGHGGSSKPESYTLTDHVNDALYLLDYLGILEFNVMGASMGSYIAQGIATTEPQRVKKLILVVPKSNGATSSVKRIMTENAEILGKLDEQGRAEFLSGFAFHNTDALKDSPDLLKNSLTAAEMEAATRALAGFDFREELWKVTAKTLIISGKYDQLNPPEEGRVCGERIHGSRFVIMENSAHVPSLEEKEKFLEYVTGFLSE